VLPGPGGPAFALLIRIVRLARIVLLRPALAAAALLILAIALTLLTHGIPPGRLAASEFVAIRGPRRLLTCSFTSDMGQPEVPDGRHLLQRIQ
jgi:hypothetical protein